MAHGIRVVPGPAKPAHPFSTGRRLLHQLTAAVLLVMAVLLASVEASTLALAFVAALALLLAFADSALGLLQRLR
jgi:hypothetical protein